MEYTALSWGGTTFDYLDNVQDQAVILVTSVRTGDQDTSMFDTLQHWRLAVIYKANVTQVDHLAPLLLPSLTPTYYTRAVHMSLGTAVVVPLHITTH